MRPCRAFPAAKRLECRTSMPLVFLSVPTEHSASSRTIAAKVAGAIVHGPPQSHPVYVVDDIESEEMLLTKYAMLGLHRASTHAASRGGLQHRSPRI